MTPILRPKLLDLFCGAGGAAMGYHRAGFEVVGVDIKPQPHYPFEFHEGDALQLLRFSLTWERRLVTLFGGKFDAIHASPPCQAYTRLRHLPWLRDKERWDSIPPTRDALMRTGLPWVMENVEDSHIPGVLLCGTMFGLGWPDGTPLYRHRLFESSEFLMAPGGHPTHRVTLQPGRLLKGRARLNNGYVIGGHQNGLRAKGAMDIDWMTGSELSQAIPPAYTEWIGRQLAGVLQAA
jgi:DNA (cytosine-5)-methyltransferase 1